MPEEPMDRVLLAHSPAREGLKGDPYLRHVEAVRQGARVRALAMLRYATGAPPWLLDAIDAAAVFHDLGKLDPDIQAAFRKGRGKRLGWDHIDAGVAHLSSKEDWMATWLVRAHHAPGLPQKAEHFDPDDLGRRLRGRRRDDDGSERHSEQIKRTDALLQEYLRKHESVAGTCNVEQRREIHGLTMRLALSCLVDADHTDTAFFDSGQRVDEVPKQRWAERLDALCKYVYSLPVGETDSEHDRNRRRRELFDACLHSSISDQMVTCEGAVGLGKTTAVTAYLLRRAQIETEGLRRLIIVAPYTNILTQTARVLRKALVLEGEQPEEVVVEHHHQADFHHRDDRNHAALWRAPIILTTAVSFFETLAACDPSTLRKFHEVPGSVIFLDEAHAALPTKLWPQNWKWLREMAERWGCRFVFASGSLVRFWEDGDIVDKPSKLPELLPEHQAKDMLTAERHRVRFSSLAESQVLTVSELIGHVAKAKGPRLVILNTVQNAAVVAKAMRDKQHDVLHLSTALTPYDRDLIIKRIKRRLRFPSFSNWTLVSTSCVEAGVDFSFRCAFRERFSAASTIQVGGRVNRHGEYNDLGDSFVYDFALDDKYITQHPAAAVSSDVLRYFMHRDMLNTGSPADVVTQAMREELSNLGGLGVDLLLKAERERDYPTVKKLGRVIEADTRLVVVDPELTKLLRAHAHVDFRALLSGSVQLWSKKISKLDLEPLFPGSDIFVWTDTYDPDFLGYMSGVLRNEQFLRDKDEWII